MMMQVVAGYGLQIGYSPPWVKNGGDFGMTVQYLGMKNVIESRHTMPPELYFL